MWAAKLPGEGACLWEACQAMCKVMGQLGIAVDGGKDSLSMAARVGGETVKAPGLCVCTCLLVSEYSESNEANLSSLFFLGSLVISVYAVCPDITATVTPDLDDPEGKGWSAFLGLGCVNIKVSIVGQ